MISLSNYISIAGVYCLFLIPSIFFALFVKGKKRVTDLLFIFIVSMIISMFTLYIDTNFEGDRNVYKAMFENLFPTYRNDSLIYLLNSVNSLYNRHGIEYGYGLFCLIITALTDKFPIFLVTCSLVVVYSTLVSLYFLCFVSDNNYKNIENSYAIKRRKLSFAVIILMFGLSPIPYWSYYLCRQALAAAFFNIALCLYFKKNNAGYFIFTFLATLFHGTAIVGILIWFAMEFAVTRKRIVLVTVILLFMSFLVFFLYSWIIGNIDYLAKFRYNYYLEGRNGLKFKLLGAIFISFGVLCIAYFNQLIRAQKKIISACIFFTILGGFLWFWSDFINMWIFRFTFYTFMPTIYLSYVLYSNRYGQITKKPIYAKIASFCFIALIGVYLIREINMIFG